LRDDLGDVVELGGADGHHLQRVRRLRVGERVTVADGAGTWRLYEIEAESAAACGSPPAASSPAEPELISPRVSLALALTKPARSTRSSRGAPSSESRASLPCSPSVASCGGTRARRRARRPACARRARSRAAQSARARLPEIAAVADVARSRSRPTVVVADAAARSSTRLARRRPDASGPCSSARGRLDPGELRRSRR
jgi:16S rRNA (uracil1498-N3)-methyltransferase